MRNGPPPNPPSEYLFDPGDHVLVVHPDYKPYEAEVVETTGDSDGTYVKIRYPGWFGYWYSWEHSRNILPIAPVKSHNPNCDGSADYCPPDLSQMGTSEVPC